MAKLRSVLPRIRSIRSIRTAAKAPRDASLVVERSSFKTFPVNDKADFGRLRGNPRLAYFDRTKYISVLESLESDVHLFLRPRRFGKSLTLSMLEHFHSVEYKDRFDNLFKGLDVYDDFKAGNVKPGQYLVLKFNFSRIDRSFDIKEAKLNLQVGIVRSIKQFYRTFANHLNINSIDSLLNWNNACDSLSECVDTVQNALNAVNPEDKRHPLWGVKGIYLLADEYDAFSNEYLDPNHRKRWDLIRNDGQSLLKGFWGTVKGSMGHQMIQKCFITGVMPLSMADHTSGFNIATNLTFHPRIAELCGLSIEDIQAALRLPGMCESDEEAKQHFQRMQSLYNGYSFVKGQSKGRLFNTNTCLEYLDAIAQKLEVQNPLRPSHSEVSENTLSLLASSPVCLNVLRDDLCSARFSSELEELKDGPTISCDSLPTMFRLHDLSDENQSRDTWLSILYHVGGLTFAEKPGFLRFPNQVAIRNLVRAILSRQQQMPDLRRAFQELVNDGNASLLLDCYQTMISQRLIDVKQLLWSEANHRDYFYTVMLELPQWTGLTDEFRIAPKKNSKISQRIDVFLNAGVDQKKAVVFELKIARIDYLDVIPVDRVEGMDHWSAEYLKAKRIELMPDAKTVANIKFAKEDRFERGGHSIMEWVNSNNGPKAQVERYFNSSDLQSRREQGEEVIGHLLVIVGCRKILLWTYREKKDGNFAWEEPDLF